MYINTPITIKPLLKPFKTLFIMLTTDYNKQAIDFLNATSTGMKVKYLKHDLHFSDDKETRDIYKITLENKLHKYSFNFGQSINNSNYGKTPPTPYAVLTCLQKYEPGTFENFCSDFGYNSDSRLAYKTYKAVMKEYKNLELLFSPEQLELLQEIN